MKQESVITSSANPTVKWLRSLALRKNREEEGLFIIEGARDAAAAEAAGFTLHTLVETQGNASYKSPHGGHRHILVTAEIMSRIANRDNAQPVMGIFHQRWSAPADCAEGFWLGLEDIRDPGNLGTIIRTCDAVSAKGVILIGNTCDPFAPETVRATMGSLPRVALVRMTREAFMDWRAAYDGQVLCTHLAGAEDYRHIQYKPNSLVIMGSESAGLSDEIAALCDARVKIPMSGETESLNLSVAAALMLYEARRAIL
jgi:TrmH family RNA methyltransferase